MKRKPTKRRTRRCKDVCVPEQEPKIGVDCISRAEAIKCLECDFDITGKENMKTVVNYINSAHDKIMNLPSVAPQEPRWIPVSERFPEDSELVLFSTKTDRVFEGRFFADSMNRQWYSFRDETFAWNNVVTAWMPLPAPFEPQERKCET